MDVAANSRLTSGRFDLVVSAFAAASWWVPLSGAAGVLTQGIQGFAAANLADRALSRIFLSPGEKKGGPLVRGVGSAFIEEGLYAGLLQTRNALGLIPRMACSLFLGATAARGLEPKSMENKQTGFSRDNKIGAVWALAREMAASWIPGAISTPLLIASDSAVFGLSEVCPKKGAASLPKYSSEWIYKVLSGGIFRTVANIVALRAGIGAAIAQHVLFNVSRSLPVNCSISR